MRSALILSALVAAVVTAVPAVAAPDAARSLDISSQNRPPSPSCDRNRQACLSGSARTGNFGARFVPPEAVAMCNEAYRACIGRR